MSDTKHTPDLSKATPGPWEASETTYATPNIPVTGKTHYARVFHYSGPIKTIIADVFGFDEDEAIANAALASTEPKGLTIEEVFKNIPKGKFDQHYKGEPKP